MHTITIRSISDSTVSSITPDSYDPHDLMGKVGNSIEQLDIILYQVISCKSKLDEIFRHLSRTSEDSRSVSIGVVSMLCHTNINMYHHAKFISTFAVLQRAFMWIFYGMMWRINFGRV